MKKTHLLIKLTLDETFLESIEMDSTEVEFMIQKDIEKLLDKYLEEKYIYNSSVFEEDYIADKLRED